MKYLFGQQVFYDKYHYQARWLIKIRRFVQWDQNWKRQAYVQKQSLRFTSCTFKTLQLYLVFISISCNIHLAQLFVRRGGMDPFPPSWSTIETSSTETVAYNSLRHWLLMGKAQMFFLIFTYVLNLVAWPLEFSKEKLQSYHYNSIETDYTHAFSKATSCHIICLEPVWFEFGDS